MEIGKLEDVIKRAEVYPQIRFVASRWGRRQGAPDGTLTIIVGDWPMTEKYGKPYLSPHHKAAYNVTYPFVPAEDERLEDGQLVVRGYKSLLREMLAERYIRKTPAVAALLEGREHDLP